MNKLICVALVSTNYFNASFRDLGIKGASSSLANICSFQLLHNHKMSSCRIFQFRVKMKSKRKGSNEGRKANEESS